MDRDSPNSGIPIVGLAGLGEDIDSSTSTARHTQEHNMNNLRQKLRIRREHRKYVRAFEAASPAMQHELRALAAHQNYNR